MTTLAKPVYGRRLNLYGYWSMDERYIQGAKIVDGTDYNQTGSATGGVFSDTGRIRESVYMDGTGEITLPPLSLDGNPPISVSVWVKIDSNAPDFNDIFGFGDVNTNYSVFALRTAGDGAFRMIWYGSGLQVQCPNFYGQGWQHVVAVWDPVGNARRIWVNGVQEGSDTPSQQPDFIDQNYNIGNFEGNGFEGHIDELRVYDYPLFGAQIDELYNQPQV